MEQKIKKIPSFILNLVKVITNNLPVSETYLSNSFKIKKFFQDINSDIQNLTPLWMAPLKISDYNNLFDQEFSEDFFVRILINYLKII